MSLRQAGVLPHRQRPLTVDFPREGETVNGHAYTFRLSAPRNAESVEICINQGSWQSCWQHCGYWWYGWSGFAPGVYQLRARMRASDGQSRLTMLRRFLAIRTE